MSSSHRLPFIMLFCLLLLPSNMRVYDHVKDGCTAQHSTVKLSTEGRRGDGWFHSALLIYQSTLPPFLPPFLYSHPQFISITDIVHIDFIFSASISWRLAYMIYMKKLLTHITSGNIYYWHFLSCKSILIPTELQNQSNCNWPSKALSNGAPVVLCQLNSF